MQSQRAILAILLIFGAGMVAGFCLGRLAVPAGTGAPSHLKSGKSAQIFQLSVDELDQRLNLKADQKEKIREVYVESRKRLKFLLTPTVRDQMREELRKLDESIRAELTEEQITKYRQLPGTRTPSGKPPAPSRLEPSGTKDLLPLPDSLNGNATLPLPEANGSSS